MYVTGYIILFNTFIPILYIIKEFFLFAIMILIIITEDEQLIKIF